MGIGHTDHTDHLFDVRNLIGTHPFSLGDILRPSVLPTPAERRRPSSSVSATLFSFAVGRHLDTAEKKRERRRYASVLERSRPGARSFFVVSTIGGVIITKASANFCSPCSLPPSLPLSRHRAVLSLLPTCVSVPVYTSVRLSPFVCYLSTNYYGKKLSPYFWSFQPSLKPRNQNNLLRDSNSCFPASSVSAGHSL